MRKRGRSGFLAGFTALGAVLSITACEGALEPDQAEALSPESADAISSLLADVDAAFTGLSALAAASGGRTFSLSKACPAGGTASVSGGSESTLDRDTRVVSTSWSATQTHAACAVTHTRGDKSVTVVLDGSVTSSGASTYQLPEKTGDGRTLLSWSAKRAGTTTTTVGERSRTCDVDVTDTYDAATKTFTLTGTVCGREVSRTRTLGG